MFGKNPVAPIVNNHTGDLLHVVGPGPWQTIQGEGPFAGHPATFIRLHGCNLRCTFCDTEFSKEDDPIISINDLAKAANSFGHRLVVITGGEPLRQNILPLCTKLFELGFNPQIETAGTLWIDGLEKCSKMVVSPKTKHIHPKIRYYAAAFKYVISAEDEHYGYLPITATQPGASAATLAAPRNQAPVYLSPMDQYDEAKNAANRKLVAELAIRHKVFAGVQLHKYLMVD